MTHDTPLWDANHMAVPCPYCPARAIRVSTSPEAWWYLCVAERCRATVGLARAPQ